jgi:hypothetical protein
MKLNIYNDSEGIFKHVSEMPEEPDCNCQIIGVCECKRRQSFLLEKIKSSAIRFKDQELVARFIAEQKPKQLNKWALAIESLSSIIFHSDTFYSIELEGYEVVTDFELYIPFMDSWEKCSESQYLSATNNGHRSREVAILKPVASQKAMTAEDYFKERFDSIYWDDKFDRKCQRFDFYDMIDFADQYAKINKLQ